MFQRSEVNFQEAALAFNLVNKGSFLLLLSLLKLAGTILDDSYVFVSAGITVAIRASSVHFFFKLWVLCCGLHGLRGWTDRVMGGWSKGQCAATQTLTGRFGSGGPWALMETHQHPGNSVTQSTGSFSWSSLSTLVTLKIDRGDAGIHMGLRH